MKRIILAATGTVFLLSASPVLSESVQKRATKEEGRIEHGANTGKLTPHEQERLRNQQETIDRERQNAMEDGKVTHRERKEIKHDQKRLSKDIRHKKHNAQKQ